MEPGPDSDSDSDAAVEALDIFAEPTDYYPPSPTPTTQTHTLLSGRVLTLRLVGHNPLWGHHLWNAGRLIATYLEQNPSLVSSKTVLELGAGAGLPSLVSAVLGAKSVVITDYPDPDLVSNLWQNVESYYSSEPSSSTKRTEKTVAVEGYCWGADSSKLLAHLPSSTSSDTPAAFDVLILADLLFNHSEHAKLVATIQATLSKTSSAKALVFFTPYRPWLLAKDMAFFDLVKEAGFNAEQVLEEKMDKVMFEKDPGDEELRRTVFGYIVTWKI